MVSNSNDISVDISNNSLIEQQRMQAEIQRMEQKRLHAQQEAARLRQQMDNSASHTEAQIQSMIESMQKMKESVDQSAREKQELQQQLDNSQATTVVHNITYNIQDSAISGDINSGLKQDDDA